MPHRETHVRLKVPAEIGSKLERQIAEYAKLMELGEQMGRSGMLDPSKFT